MMTTQRLPPTLPEGARLWPRRHVTLNRVGPGPNPDPVREQDIRTPTRPPMSQMFLPTTARCAPGGAAGLPTTLAPTLRGLSPDTLDLNVYPRV